MPLDSAALLAVAKVLLPDTLLPGAAPAALALGDPDRVLTRLGERLRHADEPALRAVVAELRAASREHPAEEVPGALLLDLAVRLPPDLLPEAVALACRAHQPLARLEVLAVLAGRLAEPDRSLVRGQALAMAEGLGDRARREAVLRLLTPHPAAARGVRAQPSPSFPAEAGLAGVRQGEAPRWEEGHFPAPPEMLAALRFAPSEARRLLAQLAEPAREEALAGVLAVVREARGEAERARGLALLAPLLGASPALLHQAGLEAAALHEAEARALAQSAIARQLPAAERPPLLASAVAAAWEVQAPATRVRLLTGLIPQLPAAEQAAALWEALAALRSVASGSPLEVALGELIPHLPEEALGEAVAAARRIDDPERRAWCLARLAGRRRRDEAREAGCAEALAAAREIGEEHRLARSLEVLAPHLPPRLLARALAWAGAFEDRSDRADAASVLLAEMASRAPAGERELLLRQALEEAFFRSWPRGGRGGQGGRSLGAGSENTRDAGSENKGKEEDKAPPPRSEGKLWRDRGDPRPPPPPQPVDVAKVTLGPPDYSAEPDPDDRGTRADPRRPAPPQPVAPPKAPSGAEPVIEPEKALERASYGEVAAARAVNTGFAAAADTARPLAPTMPLATGQAYVFWVEVGALDPSSIEVTPTPLPAEALPRHALLRVTLCSFPGGIEVASGCDEGQLRLEAPGTAVVVRQPGEAGAAGAELRTRRLFFPVRAPGTGGIYRLGCNIYCEQVLIQARSITVMVMSEPRPTLGALMSVLTFTLSQDLDPRQLSRLPPHRLSLILDDDAPGATHSLRLLGARGATLFKQDSNLIPTELAVPMENARKALWKASWGDASPWVGPPARPEQVYRYDERLDLGRLEKDLFNLATTGYLLYDAVIDKLAGGRQASDELARLMREPGCVQLALRQSATQVLPAALFYDYRLDTESTYRLCKAFTAALQDRRPLAETDCFKGACPGQAGPRGAGASTVCPSGFWGFRHWLGMPVSAPGSEVASEIPVRGAPQVVVGLATNLDRVAQHILALRAIRADLRWRSSEDREMILAALGDGGSEIIYFYCHGGIANEIPFLQVGSGNSFINGSNLRAHGIHWDLPHPLIFINGCHTAAMSPAQVVSLVQDFINAGGAGVLGTETTVFEPLACAFGEEVLRLFLTCGASIGEAVRGARLKLLEAGNPLGLAYTPFVLPGLRLVEQATAT